MSASDAMIASVGRASPSSSFFRAPRNSEITPPFLESAFARFRPCDIFRGVYHFEGTKLQILITSEWKVKIFESRQESYSIET